MASILFKYLDVKGAKAMLENSNLQFTNATKLNDPFDCHPGLIDFSSMESARKVHNWGDITVHELLQKMRQHFFICSLSKKVSSILMWSYYNKHEGVCVGLDIEKIEASIRDQWPEESEELIFIPCSEVEYSGFIEKPNIISLWSQGMILNWMKIKAVDWKHEQEVRMFAKLFTEKFLNEDKNYWRPEINRDCFAEIYLGVNIGNKEKLDIIQLAQQLNPNIRIYRMKVNPNVFKLVCEEVK